MPWRAVSAWAADKFLRHAYDATDLLPASLPCLRDGVPEHPPGEARPEPQPSRCEACGVLYFGRHVRCCREETPAAVLPICRRAA